MKIFRLLPIVLLLTGAALLGLGILKTEPAAATHDHDATHDDHAAHDEGDHHDHVESKSPESPQEDDHAETGPNGGRLLTDGPFQTEVTIDEGPGTAPRLRVYFSEDGHPIPPTGIDLTATLARIDRTETVKFQPDGESLVGDIPIAEPHSFAVRVTARRGGKEHAWEYAHYEGRVEISAEAARQAAIEIETAGPAKLPSAVKLDGRIRLNEEQTAHVTPRFPGIVKSVRKRLGEAVKRGDVLAVVESNDSLQPYEIKSEIDGTIIARDVTPGEFVSSEKTMFTVANLGTVWADFAVYRQDLPLLRVGQKVRIERGPGMKPVETTIEYLSPFGAENSQTTLARAVVPNPTQEWRPGIFVHGEVIVGDADVPVAVKVNALQTYGDRDVVFVSAGNLFEATPVEIGRRTRDWVEIKAGLAPGARYVSGNSFVLKAEIGKSTASHDH